MKKHFKKVMSVVLSAAMLMSTAVSAFGATTDPNPGALELKNAAFAKQAALEGMVLLDNNGALPMPASGTVALFGVGAYATVKGGTGSGDVNNRYSVSVREGFENYGYDVTTSDEYYDAMVYAYDNLPSGGGMWSSKDYAAAEVALTAATVKP